MQVKINVIYPNVDNSFLAIIYYFLNILKQISYFSSDDIDDR